MKLAMDTKMNGESSSDYAYRELHKNIIHLILTPGQPLSPIEIGRAMNISKTPVQKAFDRLMSDGLVNIYPQRGTYVSVIDMKRVYESVYIRNLLDQTVMRILCEEGVSASHMEDLRYNLRQQEEHYKNANFIGVFDLDTRFHKKMYEICNMQNIYNAVHSIACDQHRVRVLKLRSRIRWNETNEEHELILKAINENDVRLGIYWSHDHVARFSLDLESVYSQYPDYFTNWKEYPPGQFSYRSEVLHNMKKI